MEFSGPSFKIHSSKPKLDRTFSYAMTGCGRVETLVRIYYDARTARGKSRGRSFTHLSDILRGAVVLCHANLEQLLRDLIYLDAEWKPEFLEEIPLPGSKHKRPDKFTLADLVRFGDQSTSKVIDTAVRESLAQRSFTKIDDVIGVLKSCGHDLDVFKDYFPLVSALIERRHHIAHTADLDAIPGRGKQITRSLSAKTVRKWNGNIMSFILRLHNETLFRRGEGPKFLQEARFSAKVNVLRKGIRLQVTRDKPSAKLDEPSAKRK